MNTESEPEKKEKFHINYFQTAVRVLTLIKSKWIHFFVATISAVVIGAAPAIVAVLHAEFYVVSTIRYFHKIFYRIIVCAYTMVFYATTSKALYMLNKAWLRFLPEI